MNMRKKLREFFTVTRRAQEGFTLVELIVVIAITAILGGVAVPAYSGYIEKADRAADAQIVADLNKAFAAACMVEGVDNYNASGATASVSAEGKIDKVTAPGVADDKFDATFDNFFDNDGSFKQEDIKLFYNKNIGGFAFDQAVTFKFGNLEITLSAEDVAILSGDNAFSERGSEELLGDVGALKELLNTTAVGEEILEDIKLSDSFLWAYGSYAGILQGEMNDDQYLEYVMASVLNADDDTVMNAQIMYAASHAANASQAQIDKLFTGTVTGNIAVMKKDENGNTVRDDEATMANAALAYGMYTAYMQRYPAGDENGKTDFVNVVTSDAFETYYATTEAETDLKAYMAAMNMISDNTDNPEVTGSIMNNGIDGNTDLADLMKEVMGK